MGIKPLKLDLGGRRGCFCSGPSPPLGSEHTLKGAVYHGLGEWGSPLIRGRGPATLHFSVWAQHLVAATVGDFCLEFLPSGL